MLYFFHRVQPERCCTTAFRVAELLGNPQKHFEVIDIGMYAKIIINREYERKHRRTVSTPKKAKKLIQLRQENIVYCHKCITFVTLNVKV